ncbi:phosphatidylserine/phosphatidylglycerophosphate/ cardiolipin synthase protein [Herbaspirillum rubrisubalbicans M1]|uniref:VTT domain-containing protein n=1 Tax=Herbaspirillum rubrisubalbicans TaxID=80842 RepID=UPI00073A475B|nr:VTT domain-containing protein [Herbaspirillum rubrisubalbicans]ALU89355.1 phosphatidylserine/phosphatidylglycerophosphate/ cardiolipin synthase protein [Herbaspirillum rubrisubalbicans M1]
MPLAIPQDDACPGLLQPGRNCWRLEHAQRFKLLIDAAEYFRALRLALLNARRSVYILGWDIDSRTVLVPGITDDGLPPQLGDLLHALVERQPDLHIRVLNWDYAMLYALEREWILARKPGRSRNKRLHFRTDARHPVGASHHQKIVVIDDKLAFVGGLDLTRCRWDTPDHAIDNPLRCDPDGKPYAPFHDVQAMVDGEVACALGELARQRWALAGYAERRAQLSAALVLPAEDPWPAALEPDLRDLYIGISRTEPAYEGRPGVFEVRELYLDAIAAAREQLFFENQYFTSNVLAEAIGARLREPQGPQVAVISPQTQSGWLEQATMGALRARIHHRLKSALKNQGQPATARYQMYCPHLPGLEDGCCLNVHSKVFAMDDRLFSVGSANMSNRSMGFDTECNLTLEVQGDAAKQAELRAAIALMRNRLLAEHLGVSPAAVQQALQTEAGLHGAIARLRQPGQRELRPLDPRLIPELDALTQDNAVFDPERPISPDEIVDAYVPRSARKPVPRRMIGLGVLAVALVAFALAWRFTPLREWINLASLIALARSVDQMPFTPAIVIAAFVVAGMLMVPITVLIAVAGVVFGPVNGGLYASAGVGLSALLGFGLGHWLGHDALREMLGPRINNLSRRFAQRGIAAMAVVRLLPIAPFTVVNVVAGASHLGLRDYLLGTLIGMAPGIVLTVVFSHNLAEAIRHPSLQTMLVLAGVTAALMLTAFGLQKLLKPRQRNQGRAQRQPGVLQEAVHDEQVEAHRA